MEIKWPYKFVKRENWDHLCNENSELISYSFNLESDYEALKKNRNDWRELALLAMAFIMIIIILKWKKLL